MPLFNGVLSLYKRNLGFLEIPIPLGVPGGTQQKQSQELNNSSLNDLCHCLEKISHDFQNLGKVSWQGVKIWAEDE